MIYINILGQHFVILQCFAKFNTFCFLKLHYIILQAIFYSKWMHGTSVSIEFSLCGDWGLWHGIPFLHSSTIKYSLLALEQLSLHLLGIQYSVPFALVSPSFSRSFTQFFFGWQCSTLDHQLLLGSSFDILHKHIMTPSVAAALSWYFSILVNKICKIMKIFG